MKIEWKTCFRVGVSLFLLYLCIQYWQNAAMLIAAVLGAAAPLFLGCVIAYMINILMSFYERYYFPKETKPVIAASRRPVCMLAAMFTLVAIVTVIVRLVVPELTSCVQLLLAELPGAMAKGVALLEDLDILSDDMINSLMAMDWKSRIGQLVSIVVSGIGSATDVVVSTLSVVFSSIVSMVLGIIFAIYILLGKEKLGGQFGRLMKHYMKEKWYDRIAHVLTVLNDCFHRYIVGQCMEAVILGLLCIVGMMLLRLPYATMIGALIGFTALIPIAGAYIGAGVGAFMILTVSPVQALIFLIFVLVLQQLEGNLIYPRVVGSSMGLPAIWVLTAVTVGGGIMGIPGMLLGVPIVATMYRLISEDVNKGTAAENSKENVESMKEKADAEAEKKSAGASEE